MPCNLTLFIQLFFTENGSFPCFSLEPSADVLHVNYGISEWHLIIHGFAAKL